MEFTKIKIQPYDTGFHDNATIYVPEYIEPLTNDWAWLPNTFKTPGTNDWPEGYPFAEIETAPIGREAISEDLPAEAFGDQEYINVVTKYTPLPPPAPPYAPDLDGIYFVDRLYSPGEIFMADDGTMFKIDMEVPAKGVLAPGTNCHITTMAEELSATM